MDETIDRARGWTFRSAASTAVLLGGVTVLYAFLPWNWYHLGSGALLGLTFAIGVVGTAVLVFSQAVSYRRAAESGMARLRGLFVAVYVAVLFFATAFYLLERTQPEQFNGLATRLDAFYFTLSTLSTVGFGDVTAVGQTARAMVCAQIGFNVLVISLAVGAVRDIGPSGRLARPEPRVTRDR